MLEMLGLCAGIRKSSLRLIEVQSRINWANSDFVMVVCRNLELGFACIIAFEKSGNSLLRTSAVALQETRICSDDSHGSEHSLQDGSRD